MAWLKKSVIVIVIWISFFCQQVGMIQSHRKDRKKTLNHLIANRVKWFWDNAICGRENKNKFMVESTLRERGILIEISDRNQTSFFYFVLSIHYGFVLMR